MSVLQKNKIDGMGISKESNTLIMLITDHLIWEEEMEHLLILQDKINAYICFIETKQYEQTYPEKEFDEFVIEIRFKHRLTPNALKFMEAVNEKISPLNARCEVIEG